MKRLLFLVLAVAISTSAFAVLAVDDLGAPDWRGLAGTTMQAWLLDEPIAEGQSYPPDIDQNPMGAASLKYYPGATTGWQGDFEGRFGVVPLDGALIIDIPNFQEPNPYKDIIVQVVWLEQIMPGYGDPEAIAVMAGDQEVNIEGELLAEVDLVGINNGSTAIWHHSTFLIHLEPNPVSETIRIGGPVYVDQVIIDTICAPEPATLSILGLGMVLLRRKK